MRISARLTPDEGGRLLAEVDARCTEMEGDARAGGWYEGHDAHRADALVDLARTSAGADGPAGPEATVHVFVDYDALVRGHTVDEEHVEEAVSEIKRFPASQRSLEGLVRWIEIITLFLSGHSQAQRSIDIAAIQFANASKFNIVVALSVVFELRAAT